MWGGVSVVTNEMVEIERFYFSSNKMERGLGLGGLCTLLPPLDWYSGWVN